MSTRLTGCSLQGQPRLRPQVFAGMLLGSIENGACGPPVPVPRLVRTNRKDAKSKLWQEREMRVRRGREPMNSDGPGHRWLSIRTRCFDLDWHQIRSKMAVLNIGAYHSKTFADAPLLAALPSSRTSVGWAQDVPFPQAIAGERVVVCLRVARFWGLKTGEKVGKSLFAPHVTTRGGHMKHGKMRDQIVMAVRASAG
jgi:hypothetical protein